MSDISHFRSDCSLLIGEHSLFFVQISRHTTKGLLRDARSDVQEVLEDGMEGKVGEGRKEGNGNNLMASDIYICNDPESTLNENQLCTAPH